jgi:hypothetical protein
MRFAEICKAPQRVNTRFPQADNIMHKENFNDPSD